MRTCRRDEKKRWLRAPATPPTVAPFRAWRGSAASRRPEPYGRWRGFSHPSTTKTDRAGGARPRGQSGERGIRTLGTLRHTRFPIVPLRPLGHLSWCFVLAEREGFEPPVPLRVHLISNQAHSTGLCHLSIT